jgi:hypothetical protein
MRAKIRVVPIAQLVLDEKNANKGTKRGSELLQESLGKYGAGRSVVVDRHNRVIAGNKTVEAAVAAGMKSISAIETDGSSLVAAQRSDLDLNKDKKARELAIAETIPVCSGCGTPFRKTERPLSDWVFFQADCMEKRDPERSGQMVAPKC